MVSPFILASDEVRIPQFGSVGGDLDAEMVAIASAIIKQRTGKFDPSTVAARLDHHHALAPAEGQTAEPGDTNVRHGCADHPEGFNRDRAIRIAPEGGTMYPGEQAKLRPQQPAFIMANSGETVTYADLERHSNRLAHFLRANGLSRETTPATSNAAVLVSAPASITPASILI
jgi:non-ribosomal peptide synthetase component F